MAGTEYDRALETIPCTDVISSTIALVLILCLPCLRPESSSKVGFVGVAKEIRSYRNQASTEKTCKRKDGEGREGVANHDE